MNLFRKIAIFMLMLTLQIPAQAAGHKWEWNKRTPAQTAFLDQYLAPVFDLWKEGDPEAALKLLENNYRIAEQHDSNTYFFHSSIWWQAQTQSGEQDQEWGLALFEYLLERDRKIEPITAVRIPWGDYLLLGNIIGKNYSLGRAAQARTRIMEQEDSMRKWKHLDTTCSSYMDQGPIFSFLPDARKRKIPIYEHELPYIAREVVMKTKKDYINYAYIYGIENVAESSQAIGDWIRATELHYWVIAFTDEYAKENNFRRGELIRHARDAYKSIADIAILHGYPEEAASFVQQFIDKNTDLYKTNEINLYDGLLKLSTIKILLGTLTEEDLEIARKAEGLHHGWTFSDRDTKLDATLSRIKIQHALGHTVEAWADLNQFFNDAETDPNPHTEMLGINTAVDLALADGGTHPELELWLVRALDHERLMGNKFNELPLYEKYAEFLLLNGRFDEAEAIQSEAIRLSAALNLPKRLEQNQTLLAAIISRHQNQQTAPKNSPATTTENSQPDSPPSSQPDPAETNSRTAESGDRSFVDLQPRSSISVSLNGQAALGRYYLHNPSARPETGTLQLSGKLGQLNGQTENWLTAQSHPDMETATFEKKMTLQPGISCIIDISGLPKADGTGAEIICSWQPTAGRTISSQWNYRAGTSDKRTAVIDAHIVQSNPFYLIPIHHTVQRTDTSSLEYVDFTVEASIPTRIEIYAANGDLLAIDANGDGDFLDGGDFIAADRNRNSWPDLIFEQGTSLTSLIMYVKPLGKNRENAELAVKLLRNGEWKIDAVDEIKTHSP